MILIEEEITIQNFEKTLRNFIEALPWVYRPNQEICNILNFSALMTGARIYFTCDEEHLNVQVVGDDHIFLPIIFQIFKRNYISWRIKNEPYYTPPRSL